MAKSYGVSDGSALAEGMGVHVNSRGEHAETASDGTGPDRCFEVVRRSLAPSARLVAEHQREQAEQQRQEPAKRDRGRA
jgi:hypothetical protein